MRCLYCQTTAKPAYLWDVSSVRLQPSQLTHKLSWFPALDCSKVSLPNRGCLHFQTATMPVYTCLDLQSQTATEQVYTQDIFTSSVRLQPSKFTHKMSWSPVSDWSKTAYPWDVSIVRLQQGQLTHQMPQVSDHSRGGILTRRLQCQTASKQFYPQDVLISSIRSQQSLLTHEMHGVSGWRIGRASWPKRPAWIRPFIVLQKPWKKLMHMPWHGNGVTKYDKIVLLSLSLIPVTQTRSVKKLSVWHFKGMPLCTPYSKVTQCSTQQKKLGVFLLGQHSNTKSYKWLSLLNKT